MSTTLNTKDDAVKAPPRTAAQVVDSIIEGTTVSVIMSVFTVWAWFGNYILLSGTHKNADAAFEVIITIIFFCFITELLATCYCKPGYLNIPDFSIKPGEGYKHILKKLGTLGSFYFWLDLVASLTLILEVSGFAYHSCERNIVDAVCFDCVKMNWIIGNGLQSNGPQQANTVQNGARAGRVLRLVRMVRLVRLVKLYKYIFGAKENENSDSRVGAAMSDLTNRR
jgi:hypothetical protein